MRTYSKCEWCKTAIDVTNQDVDLCRKCTESPAQNYREWIKLQEFD